MKAILEFDLADKQDEFAHMRCTRALDMYLALLEINNLLYQEDSTKESIVKGIDAIFINRSIDLTVLGD